MLRLSLGLGNSSSNIPPSAPPAPSGIEVATTASVVVSGSIGTLNGTYTKQSGGTPFTSQQNFTYITPSLDYYWRQVDFYTVFFIILPSSSIEADAGYLPVTIEASNTWRIGYLYSVNEGEEIYFVANSASPSSNNDYIPETGWFPAITITAA